MPNAQPSLHAPPLLIPQFLCGGQRAVARECRRVAKALLANGDWQLALGNCDFFDLRSERKALVIRGPLVEVDGDERTILLYAFGQQLTNLAEKDDYRLSEAAEAVILNGMDQFWVSLVAIGNPPQLLPRERDPGRLRKLATLMLEKVLRWWPEIVSFGDDFLNGAWFPVPWPLWANQALIWCCDAGMEPTDVNKLASGDPHNAGEQMVAWLKAHVYP